MPDPRPPRADRGDAPLIPGYRVIRELGRGGFGAVFLAEQERLGGMVAVKAFDPRGMSEQSRGDYLNRFLQEARILAKLRGPREHRAGVRPGEGRRGARLHRHGVRGGAIAPPGGSAGAPARLDDAVRVAREAARALAAAHALGVVHRDVKPENVMIAAESGRAKVMDFGIARSDDAPFITASREAFGTPSYMPPEQLYGAGNADHRADIYSLSVVLYSLVTGRIPFDETNPSRWRSASATTRRPLRRASERTCRKSWN
jgi:serine/threonine-protein kinase PpkA